MEVCCRAFRPPHLETKRVPCRNPCRVQPRAFSRTSLQTIVRLRKISTKVQEEHEPLCLWAARGLSRSALKEREQLGRRHEVSCFVIDCTASGAGYTICT